MVLLRSNDKWQLWKTPKDGSGSHKNAEDPAVEREIFHQPNLLIIIEEFGGSHKGNGFNYQQHNAIMHEPVETSCEFFFKKNTCVVFALVVVVVVVSPSLLGRSNLRKKEGSQLKDSVHHGRKSWRKRLERAGHVAPAFRKQSHSLL